MDLNTDGRLNIILKSPFGMALYTIITDEGGKLSDLVISEVNEAFINITGMTERHPKGKSVLELFNEGELHQLYTEIIASGGNWKYELYRPENGNWYSVTTSKQDGMFLTVFVDVTSYKSHSEDLETFFDLNLDLFCISDMSGHFLKLNKAWHTILGYSVQELELSSYLDLIHPDDYSRTLQAMDQLSNQHSIGNFTNRYRTKKGDYRYLEWNSMPSGGLVYASCRDVTNLYKQAKQIEKQEMFRQIIDNVGGVFWLLSEDMNQLQYISPNHTEMFGQKLQLGDNLLNLINLAVHPNDRELAFERFQQLNATGKFQVELRLLRPDKQEMWVASSGFVVYDDHGKAIRYAGLIQDITKRKQTEISDREKTNRLQAILHAIPDVLITYNIRGEYLDLSTSDQTKRIFRNQDVSGKHISDFFDPEITDLFMNAIRKCLETQSLQTITFDYEQEGRVRHFENRFLPIDSEKVLSVVREVSDRNKHYSLNHNEKNLS